MHMDILGNPYFYAAAASVITTALCFAFQYAIDPVTRGSEENRKTYLRVFITSLLANLVLQYFVNMPEAVATEPYDIGGGLAETAPQ